MNEIEKERDQRERLLKALLVEAIQHRQSSGLETALRDLHTLLETAQPVALRIAHRLEDEGVLIITRNTSDAFGSLVSVPPSAASLWWKATKARKQSEA